LTFHCYDRIPERNNLKRGSVDFSSVSELSAHCWLVPFLWVCGEVEHHGGERVVKDIMEQRYSPLGGWEAEREWKQ
jgi:hypothetical protein